MKSIRDQFVSDSTSLFGIIISIENEQNNLIWFEDVFPLIPGLKVTLTWNSPGITLINYQTILVVKNKTKR